MLFNNDETGKILFHENNTAYINWTNNVSFVSINKYFPLCSAWSHAISVTNVSLIYCLSYL